MNPKLLIIRLLFDPHLWKEYRQYITTKEDKYLGELYRALDALLTQVDRKVSLDEFKAFLEASGALQREKERDIYLQLLEILEKADIGEDLLHNLLLQIKQKEIAERLGITSFEFAEGKRSLEDIQNIYESFGKIESSIKEPVFVTDDLEELYQQTIASQGLRWRLKSLNRMLGSLRKGDFGFIFARPETGKTTFLASEVSYFAEQAETPIIWINNEEQGNKVMIRVQQASLGMTLNELMGDRVGNQRQYFERTKRNIRLHDDSSISKRQIEDLLHRLSPSLVVIDQIDKVKGFNGDREDLRLGTIYQWARELAKQYCPIIGVCQADGTAEGVKRLHMGHITNAKTSKQAEADFILGIGKTNEQGMENTRYLNVSKNKLQGDVDSDPNQRHGYCEVIIEPMYARYRDIGETL
jgi:replicative DNA helicase